MQTSPLYAHTPGPSGDWHLLTAHLVSVAEKARLLAEPLGAVDLAYWIGLWHDLGKINPQFQDYLRAQNEGRYHRRVPHAIWGAALAYDLIWRRSHKAIGWKALALAIAGHHAGLGCGETISQDLEEFLAKHPEASDLLQQHRHLLQSLPRLREPGLAGTRQELLVRMLASALVDADRLDTERHRNPQQAAARGHWPTLHELRDQLAAKQRELIAGANPTNLNRLRREVYEACVAAAAGRSGVYRLTVPTGGGKTRSGLAFALEHALTHGLRRVVVAIPYTSIIDQNAKEYRDILGMEAVLEHHSQVPAPKDDEEAERTLPLRLAAENWEAPIVVTTTVQLLESLLGNHPSRIRKVHNLARSVILLDEVQTLPSELLEPTLDGLRALVEDFGTTLVLSTATQPAFDDTPYLKAFQGLPVTEIVPEYPRHFAALKRVRYDLRREPMTWEAVAEEVRALPQVMVVLNSRKDALALVRLLGEGKEVFHLSTLLCGAHRRKVLADVTNRLKSGEPVRLCATQVVEAGVNLDFPVVWRAVGPLDRIVQAAGRCNREGKLPELGQVVVFEPAEGRAPCGPYKAGIEEARLLLGRYDAARLHEPDLYREYFQRLFGDVPLDKQGIQSLREALNYREVARKYRLIPEETVPVVVRYCGFEPALTAWQREPTARAWQDLQPYLVSLFPRDARRFQEEGWLDELSEGLYIWLGDYDERLGIVPAITDPSDLVVGG